MLKAVHHTERLSTVDHLSELRVRLIICAVTFLAAFALCMWQNERLIQIVNHPLQVATSHGAHADGAKTAAATGELSEALRALNGALKTQGAALAQFARDGNFTTPADRTAFSQASGAVSGAASKLNAASERLAAAQAEGAKTNQRQPVTLGVSEPLVTTMTVAGYFALLLALPLLLYQLYAFVLPAFTPRERKFAVPVMVLVPFLFVAGVLFGYFLMLPAALRFLQNFNSGVFDIMLQAHDYYHFAFVALGGLGLLFQIPVAILATTQLGLITTEQLRRNRRYAVVVIAIVAMLLPGTDPVTMLLAMAPLAILYEGSILLVALIERSARRKLVVEAESK